MDQAAQKIVRRHMGWAVAAGAVPVPLVDIAAVTGIQLDMLKQLAGHYEVDYSEEQGKAWLSALSASFAARIGANVLKLVPGIGSLIGGASMAIVSGASTYAVGQVAARHFEAQGTFSDLDLDAAKAEFDAAYAEGKRMAEVLKDAPTPTPAAADPLEQLERLGALKEKGVLTEEEFAAKKAELLQRI